MINDDDIKKIIIRNILSHELVQYKLVMMMLLRTEITVFVFGFIL